MRILLANWARARDGAARGGGINQYTQDLARALARRGHEVRCLSSGTAYEPGALDPGDPLAPPRPGTCRIEETDGFDGVRAFEVVNSPVRAPSVHQFHDPEGELRAPELEARLSEWLRGARPDVTHVQSLEGLSAGCVEVFGRVGAVVFSLHNYHPVCPQVELLRHGRVCRSFQDGYACVGCVPPTPRPRVDRGVTPRRSPRPIPAHLLEGRRPGPADPPAGDAGIGLEFFPTGNDPTPDPTSGTAPHAYARRRSGMIEALSRCDAVLGVSRFVVEKYAALGVDRRVLRLLPIGTSLSDRPEPGVAGDRGPPGPEAGRLRLAFLGRGGHAKGLGLLLAALERLGTGERAGIDLLVAANGVSEHREALDRLSRSLGRVRVRRGYAREDLPGLLADRDAGVVPSVWWDNGPQTVLEFLACGVPVLGAEMGGIPDLVIDGKNGLLFRGGDVGALIACVSRLVREPGLAGSLRRGVRRPKGMDAHAGEIAAEYERCVCSASDRRELRLRGSGPEASNPLPGPQPPAGRDGSGCMAHDVEAPR